MNRRLPEQEGEWIDRNKRQPFSFEGKTYHGLVGDVISSALYANDVRFVGRSFKYHRPRGSYSFASHDANAMFTDGVRTNIRGNVVPLGTNMNLRAVNTFGGLKADRMKITDRFSKLMPVGFYYKVFHRPRWMFPLHENVIRKIAGLGAINPEFPPTSSPKDYDWCDVLVVGAGPTGLNAALAAADHGADVLLVDESARPGGSLGWQSGRDKQSRETLRRLTDEVKAHKGIRIRCSTMAAGYYTDNWVALCDSTRMTKLRARTIIFATGAMEQPAVFQNNDLPGVMLASAAQMLVRRYAVKPFENVIVLTANSDGYRAALDLHEVGVAVTAIVDLRPGGEGSACRNEVEEIGLTIRQGSTVYEALSSSDKTRIIGAMICPLDANGNPELLQLERMPCDGIAVSVGWMPNSGLPAQAGVTFKYDSGLEQFVPASIPDSVFVAGRVNGVYDYSDRIADGRRAGLAAARLLGLCEETPPDVSRHAGDALSHPYPIFPHPGKKNFIDFDEDLHLVDIVNAHQEGYDSSELMKRYSTVGMGPSQGKLANLNAVRVMARLNGDSIDDTGSTTSRPFYNPVSIGHLAGRRFHPMRHTAIHDWHAEHDAKFIHAGSWYRPEHYRREGATRAERILAEATAVRTSAGVMDLSTLGKIFINGPDAVKMLESIYTGRFAKLDVGKQRYAVALDESGVIIEDGVVARLADDVYYVTSTSSGAEGFYRDLQRWAMIWGLNVTIINATGHYAAMNVAGPNSRMILEKLTDIDVSGEAFPYLGVRQGTVADARAMVLRVGFVGELGYEVHVPASQGMHVWRAIMEEGRNFDVQPFGTEAQRLLRMEKGHIIIGHDTDALTTPLEVGLSWALGKNKSFFVGQRSVEVMKNKSLERKLVGIRWPAGYDGPLPEECHLMLDQNRIVGRVTSISARTTLGYPSGMALIHPDFAALDSEVTIRVGGGATSRTTVVGLHQYDPENERQA
jgi:sarcosine oxidase subunit alpha